MLGSDPQPDLGAIARQVIEANLYMTLATADESGRPWVSPVWFAYASGYTEFFWVSSPEASHSQNIAGRPDVAIVVFDSRVPAGTGQGVYMAAHARELADAELERGIDVFSGRSEAHGANPWTPEDVRRPRCIACTALRRRSTGSSTRPVTPSTVAAATTGPL